MSRTVLALSLALVAGCGGEGTSIFPQPIYVNQLDAYFPEDGASAGGEVATPTVDGAASPDGAVAPDAASPDGAAPTTDGAGVDGTAPTVEADAAASVDVGEEEARVSVRDAAERCAARLNGHRSSLEIVTIFQGVISGFGGLTSGVGGVMSAIDFNDPTVTTAMGVMSSIGAGITLIGNLIIGLVANPVEEGRRHGLGLRSWELAVELNASHADEAAVLESLERCVVDEAPPVRVVGSGVVFSM